MGGLKLYLFGPPRVELNGAPVDIQRRKALALLVYLVVSAQAHARDALATFFWPDLDQQRARAYLRRDLAALNSSLPGHWFSADRETVELNQEAETWLDTAHFQRLLITCRRHDHAPELVCAECVPLLTEAADLYCGDFMAGFTLRDSPDFDDWQFFQTESLRQELATALERLAQGLSWQGKYETAIPYARRWVALDPLHEPAQRQLIHLYEQAGQSAAGLRQYEEYVKLLDEELGLPPEEETTTLYEAIKAKRLLGSFIKAEEQRSKKVAEQKKTEGQKPPAMPAGKTPLAPVIEPTVARHDTPRFITEPPLPAQQIHYCRTADGIRLAYATAGHGPPLVKTANWLCHLEYEWRSPVWRHWLAGLARQHTLIRYDKRGCGLSDREVAEFALPAQVSDLETVVDALELTRFPLLGLSGGGPVALAYAVRHPEKVSHLILYGSYIRGRLKRSQTMEQLEEAQMLLKVMELGWGKANPAFRQVYTGLFIPEGAAEQIHWFNDLQRLSTSPEIAVRMAIASFSVDVSDLAPQVTVPTLVLHARDDAVTPLAQSRHLADLIPGARLVILESKNHILLEHEPAWPQFLDEVQQFLQTEEQAPVAVEPVAKITPVLPHSHLVVSLPPFIGRSNQLDQLTTAIAQAHRGRGQVALIEGEPGIGKSRLAQEALRYAQTRGLRTLWQKCYEPERALPYQVLIELVTQMLAAWPVETFRQVPPAALAELAPVVPEIATLFPQLPPVPGGLAEARQARLFHALNQFILAPVNVAGGLVLVVDDIQWADPVTLQFLTYLAHHLGSQPILLMCTCRSEAIALNEELAQTLLTLQRQPHITHVQLTRLSPQEVTTLVGLLSAALNHEEVGLWLYRETDGHPLFLISMLQSLQEQGLLTGLAEDSWEIDLGFMQQAEARLTLPDALRHAVLDRLRRVSPSLRRILDVTAVYGRRFDVTTLQAITGQSALALVEGVEELTARQLWREEKEGHYDFNHDKIREVVYYDLSQMRCMLLHRQVAEALEAVHPERVGLLAEHFEKGEVWDKAIPYLAQAAGQARQLFAMTEALDFYDRAIRLAEQYPQAVTPVMLLDLYEQRGETRGLVGGQGEEAVADLQRVLAAARSAGDGERERSVLVRIGQVYRYGDHYREALDYLQAALAVARHRSDERHVADALYHLGTIVWSQGYNDQALAYHQEAVDICRRLELADLVAVQAYHGLGEAFFLAGRAAESIDLYQKSLVLARQLQDKGYESENLGNMGMALQVYGLADYRQAREVFNQALKISQAAHLEWHSAQILGPLGLASGLNGNYRQGLEYLNRSLRLAETIGARRFQSLLLDMLGTLWQELDRLDSAKAAHEQALALAQQASAGWWLPRIRANLAIDRLRLGDLTVGETLLATLEEALRRRLEIHALRCLEGLAELALVQGDPQQALAYAGQLLHLAEPGGLREAVAQARRWQGEAWLALAQWEQAAVALSAALALIETIGRPRLEQELHTALARLEHGRGDDQKTENHTRRAEQLAAALVANLQDLAGPLELRASVAVEIEPGRAAASEPGTRPRFVAQKLIASGGMGQVFLAQDTDTGQLVAIKRLKPHLVADNAEAVKRFIREGEILRQLNHPNIVKMLATFESEGQPMIVMEYVSGGSLLDLLARQPQLPLAQVLSIGLELADALARVHHLNIIHRDLKPANILLTQEGSPRLTDFGVAYLAQTEWRLTQEGAILGTSAYLSPEAWRGETLDARSDIWSFGAVLYEMLAGQPPFAAPHVVAIMTAILNNPLPDLSRLRPDTPPALVELIKHMLVKERDLRLDSMRQVAAGLEVIHRSPA